MIEASVQVDPRQVRQVRRGYRGAAEALPKAINRAVPAAGRKSRVFVVRALAKNVKVTQRNLYQRGNKRRPVRDVTFTEGGKRGYRLTIDKGRLALGRFKPKQHWRSSGAGRNSSGQFSQGGRVRSYVSYQVDASGGRKKIQDAFALEFSSGYVGVFRRRGGRRLPLQELYGPSIPEVAEKDGAVRRQMDVTAGEQLVAEVESRLDFILSRAA